MGHPPGCSSLYNPCYSTFSWLQGRRLAISKGLLLLRNYLCTLWRVRKLLRIGERPRNVDSVSILFVDLINIRGIRCTSDSEIRRRSIVCWTERLAGMVSRPRANEWTLCRPTERMELCMSKRGLVLDNHTHTQGSCGCCRSPTSIVPCRLSMQIYLARRDFPTLRPCACLWQTNRRGRRPPKRVAAEDHSRERERRGGLLTMWVRRISYEESSSFSVSWFLFL